MFELIWKNRNFLLVFLILALFAVQGSPYRFADGNNGRYLPTLYRSMEPSLFPNDPVVDSFARFNSLFYTGIGSLLGWLQVSLLQVKVVFWGLYILTKLALMGLVYFLVRTIRQEIGVFLLLGAWAVHQKAASVGGDSMFAPSLTHATLAVLLGIAALAFLLQQKPFWFWMILSFSLFIHSLITLHLVMMVVPVILLQERAKLSKPTMSGMILFGLAFLAYWLWMTPPPFSAEEARLFLAVKGSMAHIAPQAQTVLGWVSMVGRVVLAWLVYRSLLAGQKAFDSLAGFMLAGSLLASLLGLAATFSGNLQLTQFQPMRMFEWVNFLVFILLTCAGIRIWQKDRLLSALLLVVVLLNILDSLWGLTGLYLAIAGFLARWLSGRWPRLAFLSTPNLLLLGYVLLALASLGMWTLGDFHDFDSFRDPFPVLVILFILPLAWIPIEKATWRYGLLAIALFAALLGRSLYVYEYIAVRQDADFDAVCRWIALNTRDDARFITTLSTDNPGNFRARALRTTLNESQSALYWVDPLIGLENGEMSQRVQSTWDGQFWDVNTLFVFVQDWNATYILLEGDFLPEMPAVYQQGNYHVLAVP